MNHHVARSDDRSRLSDFFLSGERAALFLDGPNLHGSAKSLGFDIDYKLLRDAFASSTKLIRAYYYTAILDNGEYNAIRTLTDWLDYNGFCLKSKPAREYIGTDGRRTVKGNMDVEIAVDAMELGHRIDHAVLFSGDGDFRSLIEALQRQGIRVTVVSTTRTQPPMAADDLRRQADQFIELDTLRPVISRPIRTGEA